MNILIFFFLYGQKILTNFCSIRVYFRYKGIQIFLRFLQRICQKKAQNNQILRESVIFNRDQIYNFEKSLKGHDFFIKI